MKSFLSRPDKIDLIRFIAQSGENYDRYKQWAEARNAKLFTPDYFHVWVQRRRGAIQEERIRLREEVRRLSNYDRERRLGELEKVGEYLLDEMDRMRTHELCGPKCDATEKFLRIAEQHRKTMESIAKERGEFNKPDQQPDSRPTATNLAIREALNKLSTRKEVVIISPKAPEVGMEHSQGHVWE